MADHNRWSSLSQTYTGSSTTNHGEQPPVSGVGRGGGRGDGGGGGDGGGCGRRDGITYFSANSGDNGGNNGNRNKNVFGNINFNIGCNNQEGSSYSLKVNIPKLNGNNYNEWAQTIRLVLDSKGKLAFLIGAVAELAREDPLYKQWKFENSLIIAWLVSSV